MAKRTSERFQNQLEGDTQETLISYMRSALRTAVVGGETQAGEQLKPAGAEQDEQEQRLLILFARAPVRIGKSKGAGKVRQPDSIDGGYGRERTREESDFWVLFSFERIESAEGEGRERQHMRLSIN